MWPVSWLTCEAAPKFDSRVLLRTAVPENLLSRFVAVVCNFHKRTDPETRDSLLAVIRITLFEALSPEAPATARARGRMEICGKG